MENNDGYGSEVTYFQEKEQALELINRAIAVGDTFDDSFALLMKILNKYQEQSQLLGPHLSEIMEPLNSTLVLCVSDNKLVRCYNTSSFSYVFFT